MKSSHYLSLTLGLLAIVIAEGCGNVAAQNSSEPKGATAAVKTADEPAKAAAGPTEFTLNPENTKLQFIGLHIAPDPMPRLGGFNKFTGKIALDPKTRQVSSITLDVEAESIRTEIAQLTNHLKSADFFDVNQFPKATFASTKIATEDAAGTKCTVTGKLTMHGVSQEISFPATVTSDDKGLSLKTDFKVDRTKFGMVWGLDQVVHDVQITVAVDAKN